MADTGAPLVLNKPLDSDNAETAILAVATSMQTINDAFGASLARANLLVNSGFEICQRIGPFTGSGQYSLDRWLIWFGGGSTTSVTQINSIIGSKGKSAQVVYTHNAGGAFALSQPLNELALQLSGKTLTVSAKVKSTVAGTVRVQINDSAGGTGSGVNVGTGTETLTVTRTIDAGTTILSVEFNISNASATVEINDAMLCISPVPVDYVPLTPAEDLARCLRYCWAVSPGAGNCLLPGFANATTTAVFPVQFPVPMAALPSMTVTAADWTVGDLLGAPIDVTVMTLDQSRTGGGRLVVTVAAGLTASRPYVLQADATAGRIMIFEANPA